MLAQKGRNRKVKHEKIQIEGQRGACEIYFRVQGVTKRQTGLQFKMNYAVSVSL
jgi:hypothetical protein